MNTIASLELKTVTELREICKSMGIVGMSKKRKDIVINAIMSAEKLAAKDSKPAAATKSSGCSVSKESVPSLKTMN